MLELASVGAKVLQTRSVELAMRYKVPAAGAVVLQRRARHPRLRRGGDHGTQGGQRRRPPRDEAKMTVIGVPDRPGMAAAIFGPLAGAGSMST